MHQPIPASGERAAIIGYSAQYNIAAEVIYTAILAGELDWIAITDPDAGRIDDIQVARPGRIDAYQIKWGAQIGTLSFNDLISGDGDPGTINSAGLMGQLAGGWRRLSASHPSKRVVVHLVARDIGAPSASIPSTTGISSKANLQGFLTTVGLIEAGQNYRSIHPAGSLHSKPSLLLLHCQSRTFSPFIQDCELELGYTISCLPALPNRDAIRRQADLDELAHFLFKRVGADHRTIHISRDELLAALGWEARFTPRFLHEFPVDQLYQPITATVSDLDSSLALLTRGYLAVLGTPGAGKSTTLTQTLRYRHGCRLVRYYAYVPDNPYQGRGEAIHFLHDIVLALQSRGFQGGTSQAKTREEFLHKIQSQMIEMHKNGATMVC